MLIDWFTVCAQIINFLILVWLMKRFLYRPILDAIDARDNKIATELSNADATKREAMKEKDDLKQKNDAFEKQYKALFDKATEEANAEKANLIEAAKKEIDALRLKGQEDLKRQNQALVKSISTRIQTEVIAIARAVLHDLAGANLEDNIANTFLTRLYALTSPEKDSLSAAFKIAGTEMIVQCAAQPSDAQKLEIVKAIHDVLRNDSKVQFNVNPELISGIELRVDGQKLGWSVADYLTTLAKQFDGIVMDSKP